MKIFLSLFVCVFFFMTNGPAASASGAASPLDAIVTAQQGIDTADYGLFSKAVNVDMILDHAADVSLKTLKQAADSGKLSEANPVLQLMLGSIDLNDKGKVAVVKGLLASEVKSMLASGISGGNFAGKPNGKGQKQSALLEGLSNTRKQIIPGKVLSQSGHKAAVSAVFFDEDAGRFPLELGLTKQDGAWQVTSINNLQALLDKQIRPAK